MNSLQTLKPIPGKLYETKTTRFFYNKSYIEQVFAIFKLKPGTILFLISFWWLEETEQYQFVWLDGSKTLYSEQKNFCRF